MLHLKPFLSKLTIQTKDSNVERYNPDSDFAWAQREFISTVEDSYNSQKPVRIIVLKARQLGISTVTAGIFFSMSFIRPNTTAMIIAHETESSRSIFDKNKLFWEQWPFRPFYTPDAVNKKELSWKETKSKILIATAKNTGTGRGRTIHALHASEVAFWEDAETLMTGLRQTIPEKKGTFIILESTANGIGNYFYRMWTDAVAGNNDFIPLFFPWWKHPEYKITPAECRISDLDEYEITLYQMGATLEGISWRRWAIANLCNHDEDLFKQEYPATPEEAFLTTGRNVFPLESLSSPDVYQPRKGRTGVITLSQDGNYEFNSDRSGALTLYAYPTKHAEYFIGGDPSRTTMGDGACMQVINRRTKEQVAVWHGRCDPVVFGQEMLKVAYYFNEAIICPEIEGPGYATIGYLRDKYNKIWKHRWADRAPGKPSMSLGWSTNYQRKQQAIGNLSHMIAVGAIKIHDEVTYSQLMSYMVLDNGELGAPPGGYDDAVMALAIAHTASMMEDAPVNFTGIDKLARIKPESTDFFGKASWEEE